jgi:predicted PurR-regulated permease PerM
MKYIKFLIINLIVFGMLFFCISLLLPSTVSVSKSVIINCKTAYAVNEVKAIQNWPTWNVYTSNNNKVELANDSIVKVAHPSNASGNLLSTFFFANESATTVNWVLQQRLHWYNPIEKFSALLKEKTWITGMDSSLNKLKQICEAKATMVN